MTLSSVVGVDVAVVVAVVDVGVDVDVGVTHFVRQVEQGSSSLFHQSSVGVNFWMVGRRG